MTKRKRHQPEFKVRLALDGRGRFLDSIFIERLWRSLKYECIYPHAFSGGREAVRGSVIG